MIAEPGDPIVFSPQMRARVWDVLIEGRSQTELVVFHDGEQVVRLIDLPVTVGRYRIDRINDETLSVLVVPSDDSEFMGHHSAWDELSCSPVRPSEFLGVTLAGPSRVSYSGSLTSESLFTANALPQFVVSGVYCFSAEELRLLKQHPHDAIKIVVVNESTGTTHRQSLNSAINRYEYDAIGIDSSPSTEPFWEEPTLEDFGTTGGYFNIPLGLDVYDPGDSTYRLLIHAVCALYTSNTVSVDIAP